VLAPPAHHKISFMVIMFDDLGNLSKELLKMMTPAHVARLRRDVQSFVDGQSGTVKMSAISRHVRSLGWNMMDDQMFADWVRSNISGSIDYRN
jgi:hypothetical protein